MPPQRGGSIEASPRLRDGRCLRESRAAIVRESEMKLKRLVEKGGWWMDRGVKEGDLKREVYNANMVYQLYILYATGRVLLSRYCFSHAASVYPFVVNEKFFFLFKKKFCFVCYLFVAFFFLFLVVSLLARYQEEAKVRRGSGSSRSSCTTARSSRYRVTCGNRETRAMNRRSWGEEWEADKRSIGAIRDAIAEARRWARV